MPRAIFCLPILLTAAAVCAETPSGATVRRLTQQPGHALAFDERGALYFGKERTVHKLTPDGRTEVFATLEKDQGDTPFLWSLRLGPDGQLYGAAHDRVVRITPEGKVTTVVEEDYPGPCGATDVDFDDQGNMYVAYADKLARYAPNGEKTIVLDGERVEPRVRWLVGVRIDRRRGEVYVSDVPTKRVLDLPEHPEYFAIADDGSVYVGFPDADGVMRIDEHPRHALRRLGETVDFVATLSFGGRGFDRSFLYAACRNGIFEIPVSADERAPAPAPAAAAK